MCYNKYACDEFSVSLHDVPKYCVDNAAGVRVRHADKLIACYWRRDRAQYIQVNNAVRVHHDKQVLNKLFREPIAEAQIALDKSHTWTNQSS